MRVSVSTRVVKTAGKLSARSAQSHGDTVHILWALAVLVYPTTTVGVALGGLASQLTVFWRVMGEDTYRDPRGLWHTDPQRDGPLRGDLTAG